MVGIKVLKTVIIFFPVIFFGIYEMTNMMNFSDTLTVVFSMFTAWAFLVKR